MAAIRSGGEAQASKREFEGQSEVDAEVVPVLHLLSLAQRWAQAIGVVFGISETQSELGMLSGRDDNQLPTSYTEHACLLM